MSGTEEKPGFCMHVETRLIYLTKYIKNISKGNKLWSHTLGIWFDKVANYVINDYVMSRSSYAPSHEVVYTVFSIRHPKLPIFL